MTQVVEDPGLTELNELTFFTLLLVLEEEEMGRKIVLSLAFPPS